MEQLLFAAGLEVSQTTLPEFWLITYRNNFKASDPDARYAYDYLTEVKVSVLVHHICLGWQIVMYANIGFLNLHSPTVQSDAWNYLDDCSTNSTFYSF